MKTPDNPPAQDQSRGDYVDADEVLKKLQRKLDAARAQLARRSIPDQSPSGSD